jgi:tetratricopeptide (TPR) repeat protein
LLERSRNKKTGGEEADDAAKLLRELGSFPLAISQAGAYLRRTSNSIAAYLSKLAEETERWRVLKQPEVDRYRPGVPNSVLDTFGISMERIRHYDEVAYKIMHTLAFLNNQDITFEMITEAGFIFAEGEEARSGEREERVMEAVTRLKEFSFLRPQASGGVLHATSYEMHKLVQQAARYGLKARSPQDEELFANAALLVVAKLLDSSATTAEAWAKRDKYIAHAREVGDLADICRFPVGVAVMLEQVYAYLPNRERLNEQELVAKRIYELRHKSLGEKHPDTIRGLEHIARSFLLQGRFTAAGLEYAQVLALRQEVLGEKHPDTLRSMSHLATTHHAQGQYDAAKHLYARALKLQEEVLGKQHPETIANLSNLASVYQSQGDASGPEDRDASSALQTAQTIYNHVLKIRRETLGEKDPMTIQSQRCLAKSYDVQCRYSEAEPIFAQVLELRREVLGEKHPDTIEALADLARIAQSRARFKPAKQMFLEVLRLRREVLGEDHVDTIWAMVEISTMYWTQARYTAAEPLLCKAFERLREVCGDKHPRTLDAMFRLAHVWECRRPDDAVALMEKCAMLRREVFGPDHSLTKDSEQSLNAWKTAKRSRLDAFLNRWADRAEQRWGLRDIERDLIDMYLPMEIDPHSQSGRAPVLDT